MPVWQRFYERHREDNFEILSIAFDALGAPAARPWHDKASATFTTLVDREHLLAERHGLKVVPNGLLIDEAGVLRFVQIGGFDANKAETVERLEAFLADSPVAGPEAAAGAPASSGDWETHFRRGVQWAEHNRVEEAAAEFREAVRLDPANWLVHKQLWRLMHPDRFGDEIDLGWQTEQKRREAELGVEQANRPDDAPPSEDSAAR